MLKRLAVILLLSFGLSLGAASAQQQRATPYWASIASGRAMMRTGPGQNYPGTWEYRRRGLPIRVIEIYREWRKVQDPDGTTGWMLVRLLSDQRTAIVRGAAPVPLHESPDEASAVHYRAEPGVVGRISRCADDWCLFDVQGRSGYVRAGDIWGIDAGEILH